MKKLQFLFYLMVLTTFVAFSQNKEVLTLSKGRYNEIPTYNKYEQVGSVIMDMETKTIAGFVDRDTMLLKTINEPDVTTRWFAVDPLAEKYYSLSPYNYVANNPIIYIDPNGKEIIIGSLVDRTLNSIGYKTNNMQKLESVVTKLKSTSTGNSIYTKLDNKKQRINLVTGENLKTKSGNGAAALTSFKGEFNEDNNLEITSDISVTIDIDAASEDKNIVYDLEGDEGAVTVVAHELGHIEAFIDDPAKKSVMKEIKHGEDNNAEEVQYQVAIEIQENKKNEDKK